jgi:homoserine acetyltransferase
MPNCRRGASLAFLATLSSAIQLKVRFRRMNPKSDPAWNNGFYKHQSDVHAGLRRLAHIMSIMGVSHDL